MNPHIRSLLDKEAKLGARLRAIDEAAGDEPMTEEQQAEFDNLSKELEAVRARRMQAEELARTLQDAAVATAQPLEQTAGLEVGNDNAEDQPWSPEGNPRRAFGHFMQAVRKADPRVSGDVDPRLMKHAGPSGTHEGVGSEAFRAASREIGGGDWYMRQGEKIIRQDVRRGNVTEGQRRRAKEERKREEE